MNFADPQTPTSRRPVPRDIDAWVFDLDNTLYQARDSVFGQVGERIKRYLANFLELDDDDAFRMQKQYFREYGTTLRGLMICHKMAPEAYLDFVHDIDLSSIPADPALDAALERLEGRKIIFTNADTKHAQRVLGRLGIGRHFEGIYDIYAADFVPKPEPGPYDGLVRRHGLDCSRCVMVEDMARNLEPAAALGMTTVWVHTESDWASAEKDADYVHHHAADLTAWLDAQNVEKATRAE